MIRALRHSRFVSLIAVIALLTALPASFPAWHNEGDDVLCSPVVVVHDHTAHRIGPDGSSPSTPEHCLVCHWFQLLRGATVATRLELPPVASSAPARVAAVALTATLTAGQSGRAPPHS